MQSCQTTAWDGRDKHGHDMTWQHDMKTWQTEVQGVPAWTRELRLFEFETRAQAMREMTVARILPSVFCVMPGQCMTFLITTIGVGSVSFGVRPWKDLARTVDERYYVHRRTGRVGYDRSTRLALEVGTVRAANESLLRTLRSCAPARLG
jgi:hypothetical protein